VLHFIALGVIVIKTKQILLIFAVIIFVFSGSNVVFAQTELNLSPKLVHTKSVQSTQKKYIFKGTVYDKSNGTRLSNVNISIGGTSTKTDSRGKFEFRSISADIYELTISADGYNSHSGTININKNINNQYRLIKNKTYKFVGTVKDKSSEKALGGVTVNVGTETTKTDKNGNFSFSGMRGGIYKVSMSYSGYSTYITSIQLNRDFNRQYTISKIVENYALYNAVKKATEAMNPSLEVQFSNSSTSIYKTMQDINNDVLLKKGYYAQVTTTAIGNNKVRIDFFYSVDFCDEDININPKYEAVNINSEKDLRVVLKRALERCQSKILFNKTSGRLKLNTTSFNDIFLAVLEQNEDTAYAYDLISGYYLNDDSIEFIYEGGINSLFKEKINLINKAETVIKKTIDLSKTTDLDKLKALHDYIVLNTHYDWDTYQKHIAGIETSGTTYMAEGVFYKGVAVCSGYSAAFEMMAKMLGIKIISVTGGGHAWNKAVVDGKVKYFDVTWDDPDQGSNISYEYFSISEQAVSKDHIWNANAFADKYLYY
jgi:hypothetical protein